ncbi:uncharacterized protein LOC143622360 [Bidens hawaiensis]|uniref:uncharacterized protein LOC143622360 n=1 Tax=Bidens hawaiensis TaxID=980011 RepID=UPI0040490A44
MKTPGRVQPRLDPASTAPTNEPIVRGSEEKKPRDIRPSLLIDHAHAPYPARLKNQKFSREYENFLDMFMQLRINLPFIEALQHMPKYAKFLKDLLKRKESLEELSIVPLNGECSAVVLNKIPDPGVFTIPSRPRELTPTHMSLSLADRSVRYPRGIIENLLVKVDNLVFPVDFGLDMKADERVPIILGRPFLRTTGALVDVIEGFELENDLHEV